MMKSTKKGKGRLGKDAGGHSVPGHTGKDGHPGSWQARGYCKENKIGPSPKSRSGVTFPSK